MESNKMEHMDLHQTTIQNVEGTLVPSSDSEDANSYPPKKRVKLDLPEEDLEKEEAVIEWSQKLHFRRYAKKNSLVYEDVVSECVKEIDARQKLFNKASDIFNENFGDLNEKQPCHETSVVISCFREVQEEAEVCLRMASAILPKFKEYVKKYVDHINGPLAYFHLAKDQYFNKLEELAEIPNFEELIKELLYNDKDKKIEHRSGLTQSDIDFIIQFLRVSKDIFIPYTKEDKMNEDQYGEMEDLLIQLEAKMKDLPALRSNYETAEKIVNENVKKYGYGVVDSVCPIECDLRSVDFRLRIMHQQLKLLIEKDLRNMGDDNYFMKQWLMIYSGGWN